jgi:hypothetical protein
MRDPDMIYSINDNIFNIIKRVIKQGCFAMRMFNKLLIQIT